MPEKIRVYSREEKGAGMLGKAVDLGIEEGKEATKGSKGGMNVFGGIKRALGAIVRFIAGRFQRRAMQEQMAMEYEKATAPVRNTPEQAKLPEGFNINKNPAVSKGFEIDPAEANRQISRRRAALDRVDVSGLNAEQTRVLGEARANLKRAHESVGKPGVSGKAAASILAGVNKVFENAKQHIPKLKEPVV